MNIDISERLERHGMVPLPALIVLHIEFVSYRQSYHVVQIWIADHHHSNREALFPGVVIRRTETLKLCQPSGSKLSIESFVFQHISSLRKILHTLRIFASYKHPPESLFHRRNHGFKTGSYRSSWWAICAIQTRSPR